MIQGKKISSSFSQTCLTLSLRTDGGALLRWIIARLFLGRSCAVHFRSLGRVDQNPSFSSGASVIWPRISADWSIYFYACNGSLGPSPSLFRVTLRGALRRVVSRCADTSWSSRVSVSQPRFNTRINVIARVRARGEETEKKKKSAGQPW